MAFLVFHFEIFGKTFNDLHQPNVKQNLSTLDVSHFEISGKVSNE